jgi:hypothetical protein
LSLKLGWLIAQQFGDALPEFLDLLARGGKPDCIKQLFFFSS